MTARAVCKKYLRRRVAHRHRAEHAEVHYLVLDIKPWYGDWALLLAPLAGEGVQWAGRKSCRVLPEGANVFANPAIEQAGAADTDPPTGVGPLAKGVG